MTVSGIPTSRVSDLFVRQRLLRQTQSDQSTLYSLQMQLSTGHRFQLASQDPVSAMQVVSLQRLLERKQQVQTNVTTNQSFLTATDTALSGISSSVSEARALALSVVGTTASDTQRNAAAQQIEQITKQLYDAANQKFRGRYLFAGSSTGTRPFEMVGEYIQYMGNEERLASYADIDLLFDTNLTGSEVFGAVSAEVKGTDLSPALTFDTRLDDLRGGQGISRGSIELNDGTNSVTVDLSQAETVGDVASLIRKGGASLSEEEWVTADVTPEGLVVELRNLDPTVSNPLTIREVGGGTTAYELGIFQEGETSPKVVGRPLDPILRGTTKIENILGARSVAFLHTTGSDNDLIIRADHNGDMNGIEVVVVNDNTVVQGNETVTLVGDELTIRIDEGQTTAQDIVAAFEKYYDAEDMPFTAELDPQDVVEGGHGTVGETDSAHPVLTDYGWGEDLDTAHGLRLVNGDQDLTVRLTDVQTVEGLLNVINGQGAGLLAEINGTATGINIRSRYSGADFTIGENGGETASQLGLRSFTGDTPLEELNFGRGVVDYEGTGTSATATMAWVGSNNDMILTARETGTEWNDYQIVFEDNLPAGNEGVTFDEINHIIRFEIESGTTTANDCVEWFGETAGARDDFQLTLDPEDGSPNNGTGLVWPASAVRTSGGDSNDADFTITRKDGVAMEIDIHGATTVQQVIDLINGNDQNHPELPLGERPLEARLAAYGNGIELVDRSTGEGTLTVTRAELSTAAIGLGLIPEGQDSNSQVVEGAVATVSVQSSAAKSDFFIRTVLPGVEGNGTEIVFQDNSGLIPPVESFDYDSVNKRLTFGIIPGTTTAADIRDLLLGDLDASEIYEVEFDQSDNPPNDGSGVVDLQADPLTMAGGEPEVLTGSDVNPLETEGIFTALLRLQKALETNDTLEVERSIEVLDASVTNLNFSRAELGARQQGLDTLSARLDSEDTDLQGALSLTYDADLTEVITSLTGQQIAYQASLQAMGQILSMTLLDYI